MTESNGRSSGRPGFFAPRSMLARKPSHGAPCTHCGLCCVASICDFGQYVMQRNQTGPCPALRLDSEGRSSCGIIAEAPEPFKAAAILLVNSGDGCDARFNGEPINHEFHRYQARLDVEHAEEITKARELWEWT